MELCNPLRRLSIATARPAKQCLHRPRAHGHFNHRTFASVIPANQTEDAESSITPAGEIDLSTFEPTHSRNVAPIDPRRIDSATLRRLRVVPKSPAYFTTTPNFIDDYLALTRLLRKYAQLPTLTASEAPQSTWVTVDSYRNKFSEPVRTNLFRKMITICQRLNLIMPAVMPEEVLEALNRLRKVVDKSLNKAKPIFMDEFGRTRAVGRRKTSSAQAYVVEGDGQVMVNGKSLSKSFSRTALAFCPSFS